MEPDWNPAACRGEPGATHPLVDDLILIASAGDDNEEARVMNDRWDHNPACTATECYCADNDMPDPMCDCGRPGYAYRCNEIHRASGDCICGACGKE